MFSKSDSSGPGWKPRPVAELADDLVRTHPHYQLNLDEEPKQGGMGAVYFGADSRDGQRIALKLLPHELSGEPSYLRRFLRETQILRKLKHPNTISILEDGETQDGYTFFVMPRLEGRTLAEILASPARQKVERLVSLMCGICDGVQHAHEQHPPLIHRDLKAANIFITPDDHAIILDFGVARAASPKPGTLTQGALLGTPGHIAPELLQENPTPANERSDIFSLGVIFLQILTGRITASGLPTMPSEVGLDARWDAVVKRAICENPANRYESARDFAKAIKLLREPTSFAEIPFFLPPPFAIHFIETPFTKTDWHVGLNSTVQVGDPVVTFTQLDSISDSHGGDFSSASERALTFYSPASGRIVRFNEYSGGRYDLRGPAVVIASDDGRADYAIRSEGSTNEGRLLQYSKMVHRSLYSSRNRNLLGLAAIGTVGPAWAAGLIFWPGGIDFATALIGASILVLLTVILRIVQWDKIRRLTLRCKTAPVLGDPDKTRWSRGDRLPEQQVRGSASPD